MPQSRVWTIGLAVSLWRLKVAGGPGYSTLIPPPNQATPVTDAVACVLALSPLYYNLIAMRRFFSHILCVDFTDCIYIVASLYEVGSLVE